jgi:hypothetical protein
VAIFTQSFRVASGRLLVLSAPLLAGAILAGCGGSGAAKQSAQSLSGSGFRFEAPASWHVVRSKGRVTASQDSELVQVASFPLLKPYSDALFARVAKELAARMRQIAQQTGGTVSGSATVTAGGIRAHSYEVKAGTNIDEYTFVLRGKREFQLLCRRGASSGDDACTQLISSFTVT